MIEIQKPIIVPAILTNNNKLLVQQLKEAEKFVNRVQIDIMDKTFVPYESTSGNALDSPCTLEAHLMINNPNIAEFSNFDVIIVHKEACDELGRLISEIQALEMRAGVAINPETPVKDIEEYLNDIDQVLIMTVHPGKQGQQFIPEALEKIKQVKEINPHILVEVDGGIDDTNIHKVIEAGADLIAVGHFLFKDSCFEEHFSKLNNAK